MPIFDDRPRSRPGGAREGEPPFSYLDESSRPEAARVRALLNDMASRYPGAQLGALVNRIRDEGGHVDAMFELLVHEWCLRRGMTVLAVEPSIPGTTKQPDFLVEASGRPFYLECVVARGESDLDVGSRRRRETVLRAIDDIPSPDFLLGVSVERAPVRPPSLGRLTGLIRTWLADLDYDQVLASPTDQRFVLNLEVEGMSLELRPLPRGASRGDMEGRTTGIVAGGIQEAAPWQGMRQAVLRKATRYGEPDLPFVVALGAMERYADLDHAMEALYGTVGAAFSRENGWRDVRRPDGVWNGPNGPQCRRLSAVLVADRLEPWSLGQRSAMFVENLWATRPVGFVDFGVEAWRVDGDMLRHRGGVTVQEIFVVPKDWPETPDAASDPVHPSHLA